MANNDGVNIRNASKKDVPRISGLCGQLSRKVDEDDVFERLDYILRHPKNHAFFVAEVEGRVEGFVHVIGKIEILSGWQARIDGIIVDSACRGKGVGRVLMRAAEDWAKTGGSETMKLNSNIKRTEAHKFYEKLGYENSKTQIAFKKKL